MKKKVLVYDNQLGYYKMLVENLGKEISFILYDSLLPEIRFDAVTFFMNDELEAHDMVVLHGMNLPFILATSKSGIDVAAGTQNIFHIDLRKTRDVLLEKIKDVFSTLHIGNNKNKTPVKQPGL